MKIKLYESAALACDVPENRLRKGDVVLVVEELHSPEHKTGFMVEVLNALGEAVRVETVHDWMLEPLREDEMLCVREP